jgi:signal peptidase I
MAAKAEGESTVWETVKSVFWALVIAGVFRTLFFQPFWIPSGSMKDTLLVGDFLFVNKMAYGYSRHSCPFSLCPFDGRIFGQEAERGDVAVFRHPTNGSDYIKRIVGMPGDTLQLKDGRLYINGEIVPQEPRDPFIEVYEAQGSVGGFPRCKGGLPVGIGGECEKDAFWETLPNGHTHAVLNVGMEGSDNTPVYTVPADHYFFLGDNRDNSQDSRYPQSIGGVGYVHEDYLIGRADRVIFSSAGRSMLFFWTWRGDRFFEKIL